MSDSWLKLDFTSVPEYGTGGAEHHDVYVQDRFGIRAMSFGNGEEQSAMRLGKPHELAIEYTRRIMAFLLFHPAPNDILMIGLGGGSLAKFIYYEMPGASITVAEVNPKVVAAARSHFQLPSDGERLRVVIAQGSRYLATHKGSAEVLIVDGFDANGQVSSLCSQAFYRNCFAALRPGGVFVANLLRFRKNTGVYLTRIRASFGNAVRVLTSGEDGNLVVFGFKDARTLRQNRKQIDRAQALKATYGLPFPVFAREIKRPY